MKSFYFDKSNYFATITPAENNMVIFDDQKIADIFIEYFDTIVSKLGLTIPKDFTFAANGIADPVRKAVHKY